MVLLCPLFQVHNMTITPRPSTLSPCMHHRRVLTSIMRGQQMRAMLGRKTQPVTLPAHTAGHGYGVGPPAKLAILLV
jgi:hypothetical protein